MPVAEKELPKLIYFDLEKRNKGLALVAKMCRAVECGNPLAFVTKAGLLLTSKTHRKREEHDGLLTPDDLRALANYIETLRSESVKMAAESEERAA